MPSLGRGSDVDGRREAGDDHPAPLGVGMKDLHELRAQHVDRELDADRASVLSPTGRTGGVDPRTPAVWRLEREHLLVLDSRELVAVEVPALVERLRLTVAHAVEGEPDWHRAAFLASNQRLCRPV